MPTTMLTQLLKLFTKVELIAVFVLLAQICFANTSSTNFCLLDETPSSTWNGTEWSNNAPNLTTNAIISGDYNTATHGSFSALNLIINAGFTLTVDNNTFVQIDNNVDVIGQLIVETSGAFVQINDSGNFYVDSIGLAKVNKLTSVLNYWYDYTYWSSPVNGTTVNQAFANSNVNRRFWFNGQNYLDVLREDANNNIMVAGHDDIDDNGNDWQLLNGTQVLQPGVGYATTHSSGDFVPGNSYPYSFEGSFNNGIIYTPVYYNGDNGDNDWNFIGNPYPSAISADAFFSANTSVIGGALYLWSHGTPPSATNNGQDMFNYSSDDYAIINAGSGEVAGGSGITPNRYIPSGQGFFIQGLANGNVVFNNAMRVSDTNSNSQFFRQHTNSSNKIWLNLTTESGLFNQALIAYVDGATDANDGPYFDAPRNLSTATAAIIYTCIDDDINTKLAIQGKALSSLNSDEIVPLGFYTGITTPVTYSISIDHIQGAFFENEAVFLKDKLLNIMHDLSQSAYQFQSDAGEFNNRFELLFTRETLSVVDAPQQIPLQFKQTTNNQLLVSSQNNELINNIKLYDQLGRLVAQQQPKQTQGQVPIQHLKSAIYIAYVEMANGQTVSKKILKRG